MDEPAIEEFRNKSIFRDADFGTKELIRDVTHVIKVSKPSRVNSITEIFLYSTDYTTARS